MSEKRYSPREASVAVLKKVQELLTESTLAKAEKMKKDGQTLGQVIGYPGSTPTPPPPPVSKSQMTKYETEMKKEPAHPPKDGGKKIERDFYDYEVKSGKSKSSDQKRGAKQVSPSKNPKEEAEGNNEPYGSEPKNLGKKEHEHIGWDKLHGKLEREGYSKKSADKIAGAIKAKVNKSENPDKDADAELGEQVEKEVEEHFKENKEAEKKEGHKLMAKSSEEKNASGAFIPAKAIGSAKLSKFMERKHAKRKALDKGAISESTNPKSDLKGIHQSPDWQPEKGKSYAGTQIRSSVGNGRNTSIGRQEVEEAKETHKEVLGEMKGMKKPKLD